MKSSRAILAIGILVVVFFGGYHFLEFIGSRSGHYWQVKSTSLGDERIGSLHLRDNIKNITPPPIPQQNNDLYDYYHAMEGVELATNKNDYKLIRIWNINPNDHLTTAKGIKIQSTKQDIIKTYGKNFYTRNEQGLDILGYIDKTRHWTLEFWMANNTVNSIRLDIDSME